MTKDKPSEEFLEEVLAIHDTPPGDDPGESPEPGPVDPEPGPGEPSQEFPDPETPDASTPDAQKKKRKTYMNKARLKKGADQFTDAINWAQARIMRARGDTYADIAAFLGCPIQSLTARFSREGWNKEIEAMHAAFRERLEQSTTSSISKITEQAKTYREKLARASLVFADSVSKMNGPQLMAKAKDISSLNAVARQTLGMDETKNDQKAIVNIAFLSSIAEEQASGGGPVRVLSSPVAPAEPVDAPVIEAEPVEE
jgi:hypothetical protein